MARARVLPGRGKRRAAYFDSLIPGYSHLFLGIKNLFFSRAGFESSEVRCRQPEKQQVPISNPEASVRRAEGRVKALTWGGGVYNGSMADGAQKRGEGRFMDFLAHKNLRVTSQRQAIVDTVFSTDQHFTAEQLLEWSRLRDKSLSRATVYRTLPLLTRAGWCGKWILARITSFYDPNYAEHPNHNHIICNDCEKIVEFESDKIEKLEGRSRGGWGFRSRRSGCRSRGSCEELKKLGACKKKAGC